MTSIPDWYYLRAPFSERDNAIYFNNNLDREKITGNTWIAIIATISTIALASIFIPTVLVGLKWGAFSYSTSYLYALGFFKNYRKEPQSAPLSSEPSRGQSLRKSFWTIRCLAGPIIEESIFRGFLQQGVQTAFILTGKVSLGAATSFANVFSSALFGICHLKSNESSLHSFFHVSRTFLSGIICGAAMIEGGFVAACVTHILHNTCAETVLFR